LSAEGIRLHAIVLLHPGRPDRSVLLTAIERMLANRKPSIVFTKLEDGRVPVPADHAAQAIADAWEAANSSSFGVVAKGRGNTLVIVTEDRAGDMQGRLDFEWTFNPELADAFAELSVDLSEVLSAPLAVVSHQGPGRERAGWRSREGMHMLAVREAAGPKIAQYGLFRGLAGVAHRTVLGDELVAMFGEDRLASLPSELVYRHESGRWVLTPTEDPLEWTYERWCSGEAAIIEAFGPEHFFDPTSGALPSVVPKLPKVAPYPCRTRDLRTDEWVEHNR
jgi:hypothetical protein